MKGWYYIAAYLTAQVPDAPYTFSLRTLANRLGVDRKTALAMVDEWLDAVTTANKQNTDLPLFQEPDHA